MEHPASLEDLRGVHTHSIQLEEYPMFYYRFVNEKTSRIERGVIRCTELYARYLSNHKDLFGVYRSGPVIVYL
jgi:hypothetical protein